MIIIILLRLIVCVHITFWFWTELIDIQTESCIVCVSMRGRKRERENERDFVVTGLHAFISHSPNFGRKFFGERFTRVKKGFTYCVHLKWTDKVKLDFFLQFSFHICLKMQKQRTQLNEILTSRMKLPYWANWKQCVVSWVRVRFRAAHGLHALAANQMQIQIEMELYTFWQEVSSIRLSSSRVIACKHIKRQTLTQTRALLRLYSKMKFAR